MTGKIVFCKASRSCRSATVAPKDGRARVTVASVATGELTHRERPRGRLGLAQSSAVVPKITDHPTADLKPLVSALGHPGHSERSLDSDSQFSNPFLTEAELKPITPATMGASADIDRSEALTEIQKAAVSGQLKLLVPNGNLMECRAVGLNTAPSLTISYRYNRDEYLILFGLAAVPSRRQNASRVQRSPMAKHVALQHRASCSMMRA